MHCYHGFPKEVDAKITFLARQGVTAVTLEGLLVVLMIGIWQADHVPKMQDTEDPGYDRLAAYRFGHIGRWLAEHAPATCNLSKLGRKCMWGPNPYKEGCDNYPPPATEFTTGRMHAAR